MTKKSSLNCIRQKRVIKSKGAVVMIMMPILKVISHPDRLKILHFLKAGEYTFSEILEFVETTRPKLAYHLRQLQEIGLIEKLNNRYYQLSCKGKLIIPLVNSNEIILEILNWLEENPQCLFPQDFAQFLWWHPGSHEVYQSSYVIHDLVNYLKIHAHSEILFTMDGPLWESDMILQKTLKKFISKVDVKIILRSPPRDLKLIEPILHFLRVSNHPELNFPFFVVDKKMAICCFYDRYYRLIPSLYIKSLSELLVNYCLTKFNTSSN